MAHWPKGSTQARRPCPICEGTVLCLTEYAWQDRGRPARPVGYIGYCHKCGCPCGTVKPTRRAALESWFAAAIRYLEEAEGATYHRQVAPGKSIEVRRRLTTAQRAAVREYRERRGGTTNA